MSSAGPAHTMKDISPFYEYIPTLWICVLFAGAFAISTFVHLGQALHYRLWYCVFTLFLAGNTEVIGWGGRLWSHFAPANLTPFLIQTICTANAVTFLIASYFMILGEVIRRLGPCYSRLQPKMYSIIFLTFDMACLGIQGAGGGMAASAAGKPGKSPNTGGTIMLVGIILQMIAITAYMVLAAEFLFRYLKDKPFQRANNQPPTGNYYLDGKMKMQLIGLFFSTCLVYVRSIYRVIELSDGWSGTIITTEWYFNVFDGAMILVAMVVLNVFHPGRLLGPSTSLSKVDSIDDDLLKKKGYA